MMNRRNFMKATSVTVIGGTVPNLLQAAEVEQRQVRASAPVRGSDGMGQRPNFVLIIADDIGVDDLGCYGHPTIRTPSIDSMAKQGVKFKNAFLPISTCSPSRCSIITGRYPHNTGAPELHTPLPENQLPFPKVLSEAGYYTGIAGKGHMGKYAQGVFDDAILWNTNNKTSEPSGCEHWISTIQKRDPGKPFFLWLASVDAHRDWDGLDIIGNPYTPDQTVVPPYLADDLETRKDLANYYNEITRFDYYVGLIREELGRQGVLDNTVIMVISDNGRPFPRCKTRLYDSGIKMPLIVHWPSGLKQKGVEVSSLVSSIDIAPTILELASLSIPKTIQGKSFLKMLSNPQHRTRDYVFAEHNWHCYQAHERQVRTERYMYIRNSCPNLANQGPPDSVASPSHKSLLLLKNSGKLNAAQADVFVTPRPVEELYEVQKDPHQLHNLAGNPQYDDILDKLRSVMDQWQRETGDTVPSNLSKDQFDRETGEELSVQWTRGTLPGTEKNATEINAPGPINAF